MLKYQGDEYDNGNGSLMRIIPLLFYIKGKPIAEQFEIIWHVSALTHRHIRAAMCCLIYLRMAEHILNHYGKPDVIAGVATGAIGIGMLVAEYLGLPFIYVRPEAKKHGRQNQIEGFVEAGQNVVVVEDLISTGKSSLNAVMALKAANINVKGMVAIFSYGFDLAKQNFEKDNIKLHTLSNYENLLEQALDTKYITSKELETLSEWNSNPSEWNAN